MKNNDRFRFRAWDKSFHKYCENVIVSTINNEITVYGRLVGGRTALIPNSHVELEQCTGLKDKYGKLIYEGDIIELYRGKSNIHQKKGKRFEVKFLTHRFCGFGFGYVDCPSVDMALTESKAKICKVIGNIHENPELLEN